MNTPETNSKSGLCVALRTDDKRHRYHAVMSVELSRKMDTGENAPHPLIASVYFGSGHIDESTAWKYALLFASAPALQSELEQLRRKKAALVEALKELDASHLAVLHANMNGNTSMMLEACKRENSARLQARAAIKLAGSEGEK